MKTTDPRQHLLQLVRDFDTATLVTCAPHGGLHGRPMELAQVDPRGEIWFVSSMDSTKVDEIALDSQALVCMQSNRKYVTLSGRAEVHRDRDKVRELWRERWNVWFDDRTDPDLVLLKFTPVEGEYWDNSGTRGLKYAFRAAKAYVTRDKDAARPADRDVHAKVPL